MGSGWYNQRLKIDTSANESESKRFFTHSKEKSNQALAPDFESSVSAHLRLLTRKIKFTFASNSDTENADFISKSELM